MNPTVNPLPDARAPGRSGFDRIAGIYRLLEYLAFGRTLERARLRHLDALRSASRVLVVGDGDGRCVSQLVVIAPDAHIHCIDSSPAMLAAAQRRVPVQLRTHVTFELVDARQFTPAGGPYDGVLTMFVLDCLSEDETRQVIARLAPHLRPGGSWLWADFAVPPSGWPRVCGRLTIRALYTFFGWATALDVRTLPPAERLLTEAGLAVAAERQWLAGLVRSVRYERPMVREISPAVPTRAAGCRPGPREC